MSLIWDADLQSWVDDGTGSGNDLVLNPTEIGSMDLPGQFTNMPGGYISNGGYYGSDPSGMTVLYNDPSVNPNPTGVWQNIAQQIIGLAAGAFKAFNSGSPSVATPPPLYPTGWSTQPPKNPTVQAGGAPQAGMLFGLPISTVALIAAGIAIAVVLGSK